MSRETKDTRFAQSGRHPFRRRQRLGKSRRDFVDDESGIAAMEFAIIAPIIIGLYLGLAELATVLKIERQISHSASVAGDLATQVETLEEPDVEDIISAVLRVADVRNINSYTLHLQSFERDSDGKVQSLGEIVYNQDRLSMLEDFDADALPTDILSEDSGIVVARVGLRYSPLGLNNTLTESKTDNFLPDMITLRETFLLKPRRSIVVSIGDKVGTKMSCTGIVNSISCTSSSGGTG